MTGSHEAECSKAKNEINCKARTQSAAARTGITPEAGARARWKCCTMCGAHLLVTLHVSKSKAAPTTSSSRVT